MKFVSLALIGIGISFSAAAFDQSQFQLPSDCKANIENEVIERIGKGDETFSVEQVKLVYGGVLGGASFPVVALVKTSDEVDPRDVLVKTSAPSNGLCVVEIVEELADGSTIDF